MGSIATLQSLITPPPEKVDNGAQDLVTQGWAQAQTYAADAFTQANLFLGDMANIGDALVAIPDVSADLALPSGTLTPITMPDVPVRPDGLNVSLPSAPLEPALDTVAPLELGNAPTFSAQSPLVDLAIAPPDALTETLPVAPGLETVLMPDEVAISLPATPALIGLDIPGVPALNLPIFDATVPDAPLAPDVGAFGFVESAYTSDLLASLRTTLQTWVEGAATGIAPAVELAIWLRARERESAATNRKLREIRRDFARRGFSKPPGAEAVALADALQEIQHRDAELSREIMVKQADLEQSNRRFAFERAWSVESGLITYASQIAQRAFEASKFALQIVLEVFQAKVAQYDAQVRAFGVRAEVFRAQLQGELAKLEIFRAQIEGQKLVGEINTQLVEQYKAQLAGVQSLVEIYKARISAASITAEINKTTISAYAERVRAYGEAVRAKAAEYDGYATRVKAEVSKVDVYRAQADAFKAEVDGFAAVVGARSAEKAIELKIKQEAPIELFKARTEAFRSQASAESERVQAVAMAYRADAEVFTSQVQAQATRAGAEATMFKAEADVSVAEGSLRIEAARANIAKLVQQVQLLSDSVRAGAQVSAQLAAAALSAVNLSGGISATTSQSTSATSSNSSSYSVSSSISEAWTHNE